MATAALSQSELLAMRDRLDQDPAPSPQIRTEQAVMRGIMDYLGGASAVSAQRMPLKHRYEMRTDAIIAYAHLNSVASQLQAKYKVVCRNPQKAAGIDRSLRRIYGTFVIQSSEARYMGWQAMVKEFEDFRPDWEYIDNNPDGTKSVKKVWDEGSIPMKVWAPFVPLRPETVQPHWNAAGRFNGIELGAVGPWSFSTVPTVVREVDGDRTTRDVVPVENSLWVVNNRHGEFGSIWGSPRTVTVYKFWKAYEAILAVINTAVQRKGDPLWLILYPTGDTPWGPDKVLTPNQVVAKQLATSARSGAVLTMPSEMYDRDETGSGGARKWEIVSVKFEDNLDKLLDIAKYLDIMKFRGMFISELSVAEGSGGTSSRNVAAVTGSKTDLLQYGAQLELEEQVNRYMIPQLSDVNFPELRDSPAEMKTLSFGEGDAELLSELLKSKANGRPDALPIDVVASLEKFGIDVEDPHTIVEAHNRMIKEAKEAKPPETPDKPQEAGTEKETGFYYAPREYINLGISDGDANLINSLPPTRHYQDTAVVDKMRVMRSLWFGLLKDQYEDFARMIEKGEVELGDDVVNWHHDNIELSDDDKDKRVKRIVGKIMAAWQYDSKRVKDVVSKTKDALTSIFSRAGEVEIKAAGLTLDDWSPDEGPLAKWVANNTGALIKSVEKTTKDQIRTYLQDAFKQDKSAKQMANGIRAHFSGFPSWRADLIAREETAQAYRAATLFAAETYGKRVQALDARLGDHRSDKVCIDRNGRLMDTTAAWRAHEEEHPRGTLAFRILRTDLSVQYVSIEEQPEVAARTDRERAIVFLRDDLTGEDEGRYLIQAVEWIEATSTS